MSEKDCTERELTRNALIIWGEAPVLCEGMINEAKRWEDFKEKTKGLGERIAEEINAECDEKIEEIKSDIIEMIKFQREMEKIVCKLGQGDQKPLRYYYQDKERARDYESRKKEKGRGGFWNEERKAVDTITLLVKDMMEENGWEFDHWGQRIKKEED